MTRVWRAWSTALLLVGLTGCPRDQVVAVETPLQIRPTMVTFKKTWVGGVAPPVVVEITNAGRATVPLSWSDLEAPFSSELPTVAEPGVTSFTLTLSTATAGRFSRWLEAKSEEKTLRVSIEAEVEAQPGCTPSDPCSVATFDPVKGECVETTVEDGTVCNPETKCVTQSTCQGGRCVGELISCDDDDLCTVDVCYPQTGCEHVPAPPCPGDGACQVGVCDPQQGCGLAPAVDGTSCGTLSSCQAAEVCVNGACVVRDPPEGYVCAEASPCQGEGRCVADQCVRAPATTLTPRWSFDAATAGGETPLQLHDFVLEPNGAATLSGFFDVPTVLRANTSQSVPLPLGPSRRCIFWGPQLVCADYPSTPNGKVTGINAETGRAEWTFDIRAARPDFLMVTSAIFLARLTVQSGDRLTALYEAYPRGATSAQCRSYFLVVLDAQGQLVMAQAVHDPLLEECNHPHPYGVASDSVGNLYIAFSSTRSEQAPLVPESPTLLMSYSHDGLFRWKFTNPLLKGGELAVARGLLYPENGNVVLHATSGVEEFVLPSTLGRAVIADARLIPAPEAKGTDLQGFEAGAEDLRWTHHLETPWTFWSDQLRLGWWNTSRGRRTVALTFIEDASGNSAHTYAVRAVDVGTGAEAFTCPIAITPRTAPQLLEVANGSITFMEGALEGDQPACGKCDPPFAHSSGRFHTLDLPGLTVAQEPWVGTFGGANHDHHEDTVPPVRN